MLRTGIKADSTHLDALAGWKSRVGGRTRLTMCLVKLPNIVTGSAQWNCKAAV